MCALFAAVFVGFSYPITSENFTRTSETSWVVDVCATVTQNFQALKEICVFLTAPNLLPPGSALSLYVTTDGSNFDYRGSVTNARPSENIQCQWPTPDESLLHQGKPLSVQIGITLEPEAEVVQKVAHQVGHKEEWAKRVAMDLFRFMESFSSQVNPQQLVVPTNVLDQWFGKFHEKFRRDPDFLTRQVQKD